MPEITQVIPDWYSMTMPALTSVHKSNLPCYELLAKCYRTLFIHGISAHSSATEDADPLEVPFIIHCDEWITD